MSAAKAPPKRRTTGSTSAVAKTAKVETKSLRERREEGLNGLAQLGQALCLMTGQLADARTLGMHFPPVASELADLADTHDMIASPVDFLIKIGPWTGLVAAGMPLILQMLANHKVIDAAGMAGQGVVPPEVLEAQMRAEMARIQAEAMRERQMAIQEAQKAQAEYEKMIAEASE